MQHYIYYDYVFCFFLILLHMMRSSLIYSSAASGVYKGQVQPVYEKLHQAIVLVRKPWHLCGSKRIDELLRINDTLDTDKCLITLALHKGTSPHSLASINPLFTTIATDISRNNLRPRTAGRATSSPASNKIDYIYFVPSASENTKSRGKAFHEQSHLSHGPVP